MLIQSPTSLFFPIQFPSLLLLLCLMAIVRTGIAFPQNPGCLTTEDKNFPQHVKVNLNILNGNKSSRRPLDYYRRSTSPWSLQYVMAPDKNLCIVLSFMHQTASYITLRMILLRIMSQIWKGHCAKQ